MIIVTTAISFITISTTLFTAVRTWKTTTAILSEKTLNTWTQNLTTWTLIPTTLTLTLILTIWTLTLILTLTTSLPTTTFHQAKLHQTTYHPTILHSTTLLPTTKGNNHHGRYLSPSNPVIPPSQHGWQTSAPFMHLLVYLMWWFHRRSNK